MVDLDPRIAARIEELQKIVAEEGEYILPESLEQFRQYCLSRHNVESACPLIFVTDKGTIRAKFAISNPGSDDMVVIEFTGASDG